MLLFLPNRGSGVFCRIRVPPPPPKFPPVWFPVSDAKGLQLLAQDPATLFLPSLQFSYFPHQPSLPYFFSYYCLQYGSTIPFQVSMLIIFVNYFHFYTTGVEDPQKRNPDPIQDLEVFFDKLFFKILKLIKYIFFCS